VYHEHWFFGQTYMNFALRKFQLHLLIY